MFRRWFSSLAVFSIGASAATAAAVVGNVQIEPARTTAAVHWTTDIECGTTVWYGLAPGKLDQKAVGGEGTGHAVTLGGLQPGTMYYYSIGTARVSLTAGHFTTQGVAGKFRPSAASPAVQPTPASPAVQPSRGSPSPALPEAPITSSLRPPPTSVSWANIGSLPDHFARHGADFRAKNADDYAAQAWLFLQRAKTEGLPAKEASDGVLRIWDPRTGAFAAYNPDGTTKTFFKPSSPDYFQRQPGRAVRLKVDPHSR